MRAIDKNLSIIFIKLKIIQNIFELILKKTFLFLRSRDHVSFSYRIIGSQIRNLRAAHQPSTMENTKSFKSNRLKRHDCLRDTINPS